MPHLQGRSARRSVLSAMEIGRLEAALEAWPVVGIGRDLTAGTIVDRHEHGRGQLMYAKCGVMVIETEQGSWVVPPQRAVWVPHGVRHSFISVTGVALRNLLILGDAAMGLPSHCTLIRVHALLRELIIRVVEHPEMIRSSAHRDRLSGLIGDELELCPSAPLDLPEPTDRRLRRVCAALRANPADPRGLEDWAKIVGASERTLSRLFLKETGLPFAHWRRQVRLLDALIRLGRGEPVTNVALDVGYQSPSAFIEMFREALGETPGQYFS